MTETWDPNYVALGPDDVVQKFDHVKLGRHWCFVSDSSIGKTVAELHTLTGNAGQRRRPISALKGPKVGDRVEILPFLGQVESIWGKADGCLSVVWNLSGSRQPKQLVADTIAPETWAQMKSIQEFFKQEYPATPEEAVEAVSYIGPMLRALPRYDCYKLDADPRLAGIAAANKADIQRILTKQSTPIDLGWHDDD